MNYNSFYGGRRGASFKIVKTFLTKAAMIAAFKQGDDYKEVNYEEYVVINNETLPYQAENGELYRRGYNTNDALGGAEYIGNILGPSAKAPDVEIKKYEDIQTEIGSLDPDTYSGVDSEVTLEPTDLVSGAENNNIKLISLSKRRNDGVKTDVSFGFKIPYTVIDLTAEKGTTAAATRIEDTSRPFYEKWKLTLPKGDNGNQSNLLIDTFSTTIANNYKISSTEYTSADIGEIRMISYITDINGSILSGTIVRSYKQIKRLESDSTGILRAYYTNGNSEMLGTMGFYINKVYTDKNYTEETASTIITTLSSSIKSVAFKADDDGNFLIYIYDTDASQWTLLGTLSLGGNGGGVGTAIVIAKDAPEGMSKGQIWMQYIEE